MNLNRFGTCAAVAAMALAAVACSKGGDNTAANNTTDANATATSDNSTGNVASSDNATSDSGNAASQGVKVAQDSAAAVVGPLSAATAGSLSASAFVDNAAQSDIYEIDAAQIALERSKSPAIKSFAKMMVAAHTKTSDELKALVAAGKTGDAKLPSALDNRRQGLIDNLKTAKPEEFDARYLDQQAAAHREAEILMKGYGMAGQNADLKAFAKKTAPIVAEHLKMAEQLDKKNADHDAPGGNKTS